MSVGTIDGHHSTQRLEHSTGAVIHGGRALWAFARLAALVLIGLLAMVLMPASAEAGVYRANECAVTPDGSYSGFPDAAWWNNSAYLQGHACNASDSLSSGKLHIGHPPITFSISSYAQWTWTAPAGTHFSSVTFSGNLQCASGHYATAGYIAGGAVAGYFSPCSGGVPTTNGADFTAVSAAGSRLDGVFAAMGCVPNCVWSGTPAHAWIGHLQVEIADTSTPTVTALGGSLLAGGVRRGTESLVIQGSDVGGGIRDAIVRVNGAQVATPSNPACDVPANGIMRSFRPCSASSRIELAINTEVAPWRHGANDVEVCVRDVSLSAAAPNQGCGARVVEVDNTCEGSGGPQASSIDAGLLRQGRVVEAASVRSTESVPIKGTLRTGGGQPVSGGAICVYEQVPEAGEPQELIGIAKTRSGGDFGMQLSPGPSRDLRLVYRFNNAVVAKEPLRLTSQVVPELRVRPKRLTNRHFVRFFGSIPGPRADHRAVSLQARVGKKWRTFKQLRTDENGRFAGRYRFTQTEGSAVYVFRALVKKQGGYPYEPGASAKQKVKVSG